MTVVKSPFVQSALEPHPHWNRQSFEYYAAHFLVGSGLTDGDLDGHVRGLAAALKQEYDAGVEHGRTTPDLPKHS
jgi:hypothetical protein